MGDDVSHKKSQIQAVALDPDNVTLPTQLRIAHTRVRFESAQADPRADSNPACKVRLGRVSMTISTTHNGANEST